ncbi:MAG: PHP domain-containing protein [Bacillota bacterium]|jgi:predicted metal-dependent phosphoesterase TrpH|nr:PHP domain-containing protein [Clostridia bacterium]
MSLIDLHIHTRESDGTDTPEQVIRKAIELNISILSITDHNLITAYDRLKDCIDAQNFSGRIITGAEFCANFGSLLVDILGYGFDLEKMQKFINKRYDPERMDKKEKEIFLLIKEQLLERGFKFDPNLEYIPPFATEAFQKELWKYPENLKRFPEALVKSPGLLYRYMNDPKSDLYMFEPYFPSCLEVVAAIHECGGLAFLAHPFIYLVDDFSVFLNEIVSQSGLDGVEVYYSLHNSDNIKYLLEFSRRNGLYVSGGSDYHGNKKIHIKLGTGINNTLSVPSDEIDLWLKKLL